MPPAREGVLRFNDYREITAGYPSTSTCGHEIVSGDVIGYAPKRYSGKGGVTSCATCWAKWKAENAAADFDELGGR